MDIQGTLRETGTRLRHLVAAHVLAASLALPAIALAQADPARLGAPVVTSYLGQPLRVIIPIAYEGSADLQDGRWLLGSRPNSSAMPFLERGRITVERTPDGMALVVRSYSPVNEPVIGLVIQEVAGTGIVGREFAVLLDPPPLAPEAESNSAPPARHVSLVPAVRDAPSAVIRIAAEEAQPPRKAVALPPRVAAMRESGQRQSPGVATPSVLKPAKELSVSGGKSSPTGPKRLQSGAAVPGPRLVLSVDPGLAPRKQASEEERAALRVRQMLLYLDDLTAAINERQHQIAKLEKELAGLTQLVGLREELDSISQKVRSAEQEARKGSSPASVERANLPATPPASPTNLAKLPEPIALPQPQLEASKKTPASNVPEPQGRPAEIGSSIWHGWPALLLALGSASVAVFAWMRRRQHLQGVQTSAGEDHFLWPAGDPGPDVEVPEEEGNRPTDMSTGVHLGSRIATSPALSQEAMPAPQAAVLQRPGDLADLAESSVGRSASVSQSGSDSGVSAAEPPHFELPGESDESPPDSTSPTLIHAPAGSRRLRYLRIRYADIAAMNPPLDSPARLLHQASQAYGEGAVDHAKRLLKYAAFSRPETESFWLALLELLYRERWVNEYSVNAHWFHHWCPRSVEWNEVVRLGYMLSPGDPRFQAATHWSRVEPPAGMWLPVSHSAASFILPHLDLQLVNE